MLVIFLILKLKLMEKHSIKEDWIAIATGTFLVAQGVFFLKSVGLLTGGTTGLALLATHFVPLSFGSLYFLINSPFYLMAWRRFGGTFALNSAVAGGLVSVLVDHSDLVIHVDMINEIYCAVIGGLLMGLGMLILFRHRASLGGFNVLCLYLQDKFGLSVGKSQMVLDCAILVASFFFVSSLTIALSVLGAVVLNIVLAMNHKPTRYTVTYS